MLTYLVILLDDTSASFCHYNVPKGERRLMPLDVLQRGIVWAMKENVNIQFVYPDYMLPEAYRDVIETIDHTKVGPAGCGEDVDVVLTDDLRSGGAGLYVWRTTLDGLEQMKDEVTATQRRLERLNVVVTDVARWKKPEQDRYKAVLDMLADDLVELYKQGLNPQLNILTDRLAIDRMNNCGAGDTSLTLAPDGKLYVCPAFYYDSNGPAQGLPLQADVKLPNEQLFQLDHAPICRVCDAFHCRRCVWMNGQLTGDVNTPSHQQCVAAHLERNASRRLQQQMMAAGIRLEGAGKIPEVDYLDPFVIATRWK